MPFIRTARFLTEDCAFPQDLKPPERCGAHANAEPRAVTLFEKCIMYYVM